MNKQERQGGDRPVAIWKTVLACCLLFITSFLFVGVLWALLTWDSISTDELLWHLRGSLSGANTDMIRSFVLITVPGALIVVGIPLVLYLRAKEDRRRRRIMYRVIQILAGAMLVLAFLFAWIGFGIGEYIRYQFTNSTYIADHYVDPASVEITFPEKKRNLIVIYMESMEVTFTDREEGGAFARNVIPELTELAKAHEDFSGNSGKLNGGISLPGAVWTMGALFGTGSGLPLKTPLGQNGMGENEDFFPGVVTMGDILKKEGYRNRLLMGSDSSFGGCRKYYQEHGDFEIHDYVYAVQKGLIPEDYFVFWGYEDAKLFGFARDELKELAAGDQPFQLVIQTIDTHFEDGWLCPDCSDDFPDDQYATVMNCSSRRVRQFVDWIQQQDFYENTTIVITGDHPTMDKNFCEGVPEDYQRKTYTCVINGAAAPKDPEKTRVFSTFDLFPTMLAAMGVRIEGDRLGLGTNLYADLPTITEQDSLEKVEEQISSKSELMESMFWAEYRHPPKKTKDTDGAKTPATTEKKEQTEESK